MTWKTGDLEPDLAGTFLDGGAPASLEDAVAVRVHITKPHPVWDPELEVWTPPPVIDRAVGTGNQTTAPGTWSMTWATNDLDQSGTYRAELEVEWAVGRTQTTPTVAFYVAPQIA